jgi:hypothetical protein
MQKDSNSCPRMDLISELYIDPRMGKILFESNALTTRPERHVMLREIVADRYVFPDGSISQSQSTDCQISKA